MVSKEIVREWLAKANEDFEFARVNLEEGKNFFPQICFHFQQAAEKFLKAYVIAHELEFRKTHDLLMLLKTCQENDSSFEELLGDCEFLSPYYVDTRYPVHWPTHFTQEETKKALQSARHVKSFMEHKLASFL